MLKSDKLSNLNAVATEINRHAAAVVVVVGLAVMALIGDWLRRWAAGHDDQGDGDGA